MSYLAMFLILVCGYVAWEDSGEDIPEGTNRRLLYRLSFVLGVMLGAKVVAVGLGWLS